MPFYWYQGKHTASRVLGKGLWLHLGTLIIAFVLRFHECPPWLPGSAPREEPRPFTTGFAGGGVGDCRLVEAECHGGLGDLGPVSLGGSLASHRESRGTFPRLCFPWPSNDVITLPWLNIICAILSSPPHRGARVPHSAAGCIRRRLPRAAPRRSSSVAMERAGVARDRRYPGTGTRDSAGRRGRNHHHHNNYPGDIAKPRPNPGTRPTYPSPQHYLSLRESSGSPDPALRSFRAPGRLSLPATDAPPTPRPRFDPLA